MSHAFVYLVFYFVVFSKNCSSELICILVHVDASAYALQVFRTLDCNKTGAVTFKEFLIWLSTVSRGNIRDKLTWIFNFYDINGDGFISKEELSTVIRAIYLLMGDRMNCQITKKRSEPCDFDMEDIIQCKTNRFFRVSI